MSVFFGLVWIFLSGFKWFVLCKGLVFFFLISLCIVWILLLVMLVGICFSIVLILLLIIKKWNLLLGMNFLIIMELL